VVPNEKNVPVEELEVFVPIETLSIQPDVPASINLVAIESSENNEGMILIRFSVFTGH
jgi:hypothetical protein